MNRYTDHETFGESPKTRDEENAILFSSTYADYRTAILHLLQERIDVQTEKMEKQKMDFDLYYETQKESGCFEENAIRFLLNIKESKDKLEELSSLYEFLDWACRENEKFYPLSMLSQTSKENLDGRGDKAERNRTEETVKAHSDIQVRVKDMDRLKRLVERHRREAVELPEFLSGYSEREGER